MKSSDAVSKVVTAQRQEDPRKKIGDSSEKQHFSDPFPLERSATRGSAESHQLAEGTGLPFCRYHREGEDGL